MAVRGDTTVFLQVDDRYMAVNDEWIALDAPPRIVSDRSAHTAACRCGSVRRAGKLGRGYADSNDHFIKAEKQKNKNPEKSGFFVL